MLFCCCCCCCFQRARITTRNCADCREELRLEREQTTRPVAHLAWKRVRKGNMQRLHLPVHGERTFALTAELCPVPVLSALPLPALPLSCWLPVPVLTAA